MLELENDSGKIIKIEKAQGKIAWSLYSKLLSECLKHNIKLADTFDEIFKKIKSGDAKATLAEEIPSELIEKLLQIFMVVGSSDEIRGLFVKCCERSLYGDSRITEDLLNENPQDYNLIFFACLKVNVLPFFFGIKGLVSSLLSSKT